MKKWCWLDLLLVFCVCFIPAAGFSQERIGSASTTENISSELEWSSIGSTTMDPPLTADLHGVWGSSKDNVFVVGKSATILRYNGSGWGKTTTNPAQGWNLYDVWGTDAEHIYAVGDYRGRFSYHDGSWDKVASWITNYSLYSIGGTPDRNLYAVGDLKTIGGLFVPRFYNFETGKGDSWNPSKDEHKLPYSLYGCWVSPTKDMFAVGEKGTVATLTGRNFSDRFTWHKMSVPTSSDLHGIWGTSNSDMFVVGKDGVILHCSQPDGTGWSAMASPTSKDLHAVWGTTSNNVYAVGSNGTVLHYDGTQWHDISNKIPVSEDLNDIWGSSGDDIYIVGNNGTILHSVYCKEGQTQPCYCPDGTVKEQTCKPDGRGWEPCDCTYYSYWCDNETGLCWQNPQKDAFTPGDGGLPQPDAVRYCQELVFGGYDDWRLPNIDEMRTLIRGNPGTETGGDCPITEGSPMADMADEACAPNTEFGGPGIEGCYWPPELTGTCNKPDPAAEGHPLEFVSSTVASDNAHWVGCVLFDNGAASFNHINSLADVRCVRTGPTTPVACEEGSPTCVPGETRQCTASNGKTGAQVCADDGSCFGPCESTEFTPSPPITDVCDQCDQVILTIKVPEKLQTPPKELMAFLYSAVGWTFPPARPPDGGVDYDQVMDPVIDVDKPLTLTVPGCTYYRESCLTGDYYLYVSLLWEVKMPPTVKEGDYWWGMPEVQPEPLTLGMGPQKVIEMEIMLVPYQ